MESLADEGPEATSLISFRLSSLERNIVHTKLSLVLLRLHTVNRILPPLSVDTYRSSNEGTPDFRCAKKCVNKAHAKVARIIMTFAILSFYSFNYK